MIPVAQANTLDSTRLSMSIEHNVDQGGETSFVRSLSSCHASFISCAFLMTFETMFLEQCNVLAMFIWHPPAVHTENLSILGPHDLPPKVDLRVHTDKRIDLF